ncbi:MAG: DM13 domain-containing protein [Acidiferrobacterales bacterium]|nr:DM13 domain-containing protein [Acidiferrobacterales bacterium]
MPNTFIRQFSLGFLLFASILFFPFQSFADTQLQGSFVGASDHVTTGTVSVIKENNEYFVVLGPDFSLDGAPDPKVGFGTSGNYDIQSQLGHLNSNTGEQKYKIPADLNIESYNEIYIWCEKFSVPLGVAKIR